MKIYSDDPAPIGGQNYTLLCNISDEVQTYEHQWKRNGTTLSSEPSLYFIPLSLSDGGVYICESVIFPEVNDTIDLVVQSKVLTVTMRTIHFHLFLAVPAPVSIIVRSNKLNPIRPIASDVSLQCDVELSVLGRQIPLAVNVMWIGPNSEVPIATNRTLLSEGMRNTSVMITVQAFGRLDSGNYSCTAFLSSTSLFLNISQSLSSTIVVTTGMKWLLNLITYMAFIILL